MKNYLKEIYAMHSIYGLAGSLIGIFIPIYLLHLNHQLRDIIIFYLVYSVTLILFFFLISWLSTHVGLKRIILSNFPFLFIYIAMLYLLGKGLAIPLSLLATVSGLQAALYWFPLHILFIRHSDIETMGSNVAKLSAWPQIAGMFGPLIGGIIIFLTGFQSLILLAGFIYLLAVVPIVRLPEIPIEINFSLRNFLNLFRENTKYFFVEIIENMREDAEAIIVPIFLFLTFHQILSVGLIGLFASLGGIIFTFLVGKHTDRVNKKKLMKISAVVILAAWLIRFYFPNEIIFYISTLIVGFAGILLTLPFTTIIYNLAKGNNVEEFIVFREIPVTIGRIVIYSFGFLLANEISYLFPILALSSMVFFLY